MYKPETSVFVAITHILLKYFATLLINCNLILYIYIYIYKTEVPEEPYDPRSLYDQLQEQKLKKEEEYAEKLRFSK